MSDAIYLYGFVPRGAPSPPSDLAGIEEHPVEALDLGGFTGAVSRVPSERFTPKVLDERVQDIGWVGEQGLRHEGVVAWLVDHGDVVPAPFLSVFSSEEALRSSAAERSDFIVASLERFGGRREWDIKVAYDRGKLAAHLGAVSEEVARLDAEIAEAEPGRGFLLERKRTELVRDLVASTASRLASELLDSLEPHSEEVVRLPLPRTGPEVAVVLSAALLVEREAERELDEHVRERVGELESLGLRIDFTGPWAPYRFIQRESGE